MNERLGGYRPAPWLDFRRPNTTFPSGPWITAATPTRGLLFDDVAIADCIRGCGTDADWMDSEHGINFAESGTERKGQITDGGGRVRAVLIKLGQKRWQF